MSIAVPERHATVGDDWWTILAALVWIRERDEAKALDHLEQVKVDRALLRNDLSVVADYRRLKSKIRERELQLWGFRDKPPGHFDSDDDNGAGDRSDTASRRELIPDMIDREICQHVRGIFDVRLVYRRVGARAHLRPPRVYRDVRLSREQVIATWQARSSSRASTAAAEQRALAAMPERLRAEPKMLRADFIKQCCSEFGTSQTGALRVWPSARMSAGLSPTAPPGAPRRRR